MSDGPTESDSSGDSPDVDEPADVSGGAATAGADAKALLLARCSELGFDLVAVTPAELPERYTRVFKAWIDAGMHGNMDYLAKRVRDNVDVQALLPGARSVVCLAMNYYRADTGPIAPDAGQVSRYAVTRDYHKVIGGRLKALRQYVETVLGGRARAFVDIGPILERAHGEVGGLGYIGKNTCLITREYGSWVFLAALITDLELPLDHHRVTLRCGSCRLCIDLCPTQAIREDRTLDARRCISYLTIENHGPIPEELRPGVGNWLFGCDICQEVCPHNHRAKPTKVDDFRNVRIGERSLPLAELLAIASDEEFTARFAGTPLIRAKRRGLLRNACVVAGNSGRAELLPALAALCARETDEMLLEHARWAMGRLEGGV